MKKYWILGALVLVLLIAFLKREELKDVLPQGPSYKKETLKIVFNTPSTDLTPFSLDLNNLTRTANVYEGLVGFDRHLKMVPLLALSWGNLSPTVWEFKLRREVVFHDGTPFNAESVIQNFTEVKTQGLERIAPYLNTIKDIRKVDDFTLHVETEAPDPLLLSKLTKFRIHREGKSGTGPYVIQEDRGGSLLSFSAFPDYWGRQPRYRTVEYQVMESTVERKRAFENGKIDILAAVPRAQALELPQEQLKKSFGLEVNFLMFKLDDPLFKGKTIREAIRTLFDPAKIEAIGNYFVRPASQFIAPGVYGFNPSIPPFAFNEKTKAHDLFGKRLEKLTFDYLDTFSTLSEYLMKELKPAGFSIKGNPILPEELLQRIQKNESQLFLIGWQAEDGDAGGFLDAFIHSKGELNGGRYKNPDVDRLIELARSEMDPQKRLQTLQDIMLKLEEDAIGIPLFESSRIYAVKPGVAWEPRVDGLVLAAEVE